MQSIADRFPAKPLEGLVYIIRLSEIADADNYACCAVESRVPVAASTGAGIIGLGLWKTSKR